MPQAAAAAVVAWVGAVGTAATVVYAAVYIAVTLAINYGINKLTQSLSGKKKGNTTGAIRDVTVRGTFEPMQMIYGEVRAPGCVAFYGTSGTSNKYLHMVIAYAGHQCEDISDVWLDSRRVQDGQIAGDGAVSTSDFQDSTTKLYVHRYLGTKAQTYDTVLLAAFARWSTNHRGAGVAYVHYRLEKSDKVWPAGAPGSFYALVRGRRLYDPRLDSTAGGAGSHRSNDATTWAWSQNPTLARRDYITGGSRWYDVATPEPRLGFGAPSARVDDSYTITAANIDDENVSVPDGGGGSITQDRYTCDVQLSCGDTHRENLDILNSAAVGSVTYVNGQYRIYSGAYDTPAITIGEDDILGPVTVSTHPNGEDLYNFVTGTYYDDARDWSLSPFPSITNSSYETDDGGQYPRKIELHATRNTYRAQRIGILHLTQSRNKITVRFERLSPKAMAIAQHETFMVTISEFGWSSKVFRCDEWEWMPDGFVAITAREESSSSYTDPSVATYATGTDTTVETPEYDEPDSPLSLTATPSLDGPLLQWTATSPRNPRAKFAVYQYTASTPFASATRIWEGDTLWLQVRHTDVADRYYWVVEELNGLQSAAYPVGAGTVGRAAELGQWIARGNNVVRGTTAQKVGGSSAWDSDVYSRQGFTTCHLVFKASQTNAPLMFGINQDPGTDMNFASIDAAFYANTGGALQIYEGGTPISPAAPYNVYTTDTELAITHDGTNIRYYYNRILIRTVAAAGLTFFGDSSFFTPGGAVNSLRFGPGTNLDSISTPQLGDDAASELILATARSSAAISTLATSSDPSNALNPYTTIINPSFTATFDGEVLVSFSALFGVISGSHIFYSIRLVNNTDVTIDGHEYGDILPTTAVSTTALPFASNSTFSVVAGKSYNIDVRLTRSNTSTTNFSVRQALLQVLYRKK